LSSLQERLELSHIPALDEERVGIVAAGKQDTASVDAMRPETML